MSNNPNTKSCPDCHVGVEKQPNGDVICPKCGLVVYDPGKKTSDAIAPRGPLMHLELAQKQKTADGMLVRENMHYKLMQVGASEFEIISKETGSVVASGMKTLNVADKVFDDLSARKTPGK